MNEQSKFKVPGAPFGFAIGLSVTPVSHAKARTGLKILLGVIFPLILFLHSPQSPQISGTEKFTRLTTLFY